MRMDLGSGKFEGQPPQSVRTIAELAPIFADQESAEAMPPDTIVYETHGCPGEVEGEPRLLYATTIIHPGTVGDEFFMTRGHFHEKPARGELMFTLSGEGELVLMGRDGTSWTEKISAGSVHDINGLHAHRVVNTGSVPLVFLVAWMSDCGHDYESIRESGFGKRILRASLRGA